MTGIIEKINSIENVCASCINNTIFVNNKNKFSTSFPISDIKFFHYINSPDNELCLKINFDEINFLIITPIDFAFNTLQASIIEVKNLPRIISVNELLMLANDYLCNPEPTNNLDETLAHYLLIRQLIISALNKNFKMDELLQKVKTAAENTSIGDITIYD